MRLTPNAKEKPRPFLQAYNSPATGLLSAVNSLHDPQSKQEAGAWH